LEVLLNNLSVIADQTEQIAFNCRNKTTDDILWAHMNSTGEIFSPELHVVGTLDYDRSHLKALADHKSGSIVVEHDYTKATVIFDGASQIEAISFTEQYEIDSYNLLLDKFKKQIGSFALQSYSDRNTFLYGDNPTPEDQRELSVEIFWSRQSNNLLSYWQPEQHVDGHGGKRAGWVIGHIAAIGAQTLHYPGLLKIDSSTGKITQRIAPGVSAPMGSICRLYRTGVHAKPSRFSGGRLFFRTFHKLAS
jgi:hypothetical protein